MICSKEDTKLINEVMRDFTNITKIAAIFVNNRGKVLSQEYNFSPFCKVVRRNPIYAKRCNQCDLYGGLDATKELSSCPYRCHMGLIDFSVPVMKDGGILGFIMAGQTKTEDTTIKPILPTQTDWHEDTKLRALYQALPTLTAEQIYSATKVLRILVEHYFPFNDLVAEELPYEQLPDFIESEQPINRPEIRKAILYIEKNLSKRVSLRRIADHIHLSESYFSKIFKDDTGLSVMQYITLLRMQEAKKLLAEGLKEAGQASFPKMSMLINESGNNKVIAEYIQEQLRKNLNIQLDLEIMTAQERFSRMSQKDFDMVFAGWSGDYPDAITYLDLFESTGGNNNGSYKNPEYDALVKTVRSTADQNVRIPALVKIEGIFG